MTSTEEMSRDAALCLAVANKAISAGVEIGIQKAIEYIESEKQKERKGRYDRRLHNTELLLKKYPVLKKHVEGAVFSSQKVKENAIDILDSLDDRVMSDGI
ncbi:MAG: hypothetical protein IJH94_03135, partial [Clostridia bacterium]|nr:hypothetical protein [Clostridia bacterium]